LVGPAIGGHVPGQFLQADDIEITERLDVLQGVGVIRVTVTRFAVLHVPREDSHLLDAGMHK